MESTVTYLLELGFGQNLIKCFKRVVSPYWISLHIAKMAIGSNENAPYVLTVNGPKSVSKLRKRGKDVFYKKVLSTNTGGASPCIFGQELLAWYF